MRRAILPVLLGVTLGGCSSGGGGGATGPTTPATTGTPAPGPTASAATATDPIFDQSRLHDVRINIDPSDWEALQENFRTNQYYAADITLDTVVVRQVGIRSRGSGSRDEEKPALKVDFNKYVPAQEYGVYKTMVLDNQVQDPSFLRERLAFAAFEGMGIPAPQNSFARLSVNGQYWGLYQVTEAISKPFLKARLGEESGNLFDYQYAFPWDFSFLGDDPQDYVPEPFEPQTNEDHLDATGLIDFIRAINGATDATFSADMGAWLDRERFLTHLAVENAVAESDGIVGRLGANNFYLYQYGGQRRFVFLPWDKDTSVHGGDPAGLPGHRHERADPAPARRSRHAAALRDGAAAGGDLVREQPVPPPAPRDGLHPDPRGGGERPQEALHEQRIRARCGRPAGGHRRPGSGRARPDGRAVGARYSVAKASLTTAPLAFSDGRRPSRWRTVAAVSTVRTGRVSSRP